MEGTYPLPEAQLDRFLFKLLVGFPSAHDLTRIVTATTGMGQPRSRRVADGATLLRVSMLAREVPIASHVLDYAVRLVLATHPDRPGAPKVTSSYVRYGASPRGAQALVLAGRIRALLEGRLNVAFEDIRWAALPALRHRVILNLQADVEGMSTDRVIGDLLERVPEE
jgi:MoxR-like ATPase